MLPSVIAVTTTLQNFGLHQFQSLPWEFQLMTAHTRVHSESSCKSLSLACSFHSIFCMLVFKSCLRPCSGYDQSLCFVCAYCVRHESIYRTHTQSHIHCQESVVSINERSITSVALVTCSVSQSCWICVSRWFELFRHRVMWVCVCMVTYASFDHSHT